LEQLKSPQALVRAQKRGQRILATIAEELGEAKWFDVEWLDKQLSQALEQFDRGHEYS